MTEVEKYQGKFIEKQKEKKRKLKEEAKQNEEAKDINMNTTKEEAKTETQNIEPSIESNLDQDNNVKTRQSETDSFDISNIDITSTKWVKENLLKDGTQFLGWKKTIRRIMKLSPGKSILKKKMKKALRRAYENSNIYSKEDRKQLNTLIEQKLQQSKRVRLFADLVQPADCTFEE